MSFRCFAQCDQPAVDAAMEDLVPSVLAEIADRAPASLGDAEPSERTPLALDFDAPTAAPDYLVHGLFERGTLGVLSGDTGAAKSIVASDLVVAVATGRSWLSAAVDRGQVFVLDEENPSRLIRARLGALGMTNDCRDQLSYFAGIGAALGAGDWLQWLRERAAGHDLVVIDTAAAATVVDINDNTEVARLLGQLRRIARDLHLVVLILHHERKPQTGQTRDSGHAMMGARQWAGQADTHLSLAVAGELVAEASESGHQRLSRTFKVALPKSRDGETSPPSEVVVTSEKDPSRRLLWMRVEAVQPDAANSLPERALALLTEASEPLSATRVTAALQARKQDVTDALRRLEAEHCATRTPNGWIPVPKRPEQSGTHDPRPQAQVFPDEAPPFRGAAREQRVAGTLTEDELVDRLKADFAAREVAA